MNRQAHALVTTDDWAAWQRARAAWGIAHVDGDLIVGHIRARNAQGRSMHRSDMRKAIRSYYAHLLSADPAHSLQVDHLVDELVARRLDPLIEHEIVETCKVGPWTADGLQLTERGERLAAARLGRVVADEVRLCCFVEDAPRLFVVRCLNREHEVVIERKAQSW